TGLSRQTVITAIRQLTEIGILATNKANGRSTAYRIIRQAPSRPPRSPGQNRSQITNEASASGPLFLEDSPTSGPEFLDGGCLTGTESSPLVAQSSGRIGHQTRPKLDKTEKRDTTSIPIPGTPFHLGADGRLQVAVDLQELLTNQGIPANLASRLVAEKAPE